jgi:hypothetical protein
MGKVNKGVAGTRLDVTRKTPIQYLLSFQYFCPVITKSSALTCSAVDSEVMTAVDSRGIVVCFCSTDNLRGWEGGGSELAENPCAPAETGF